MGIIVSYILIWLGGLLIGFGLYHWVLGNAGIFGKAAHNAVEHRLNKAGKTILGIEHKAERGFGLRKRN